MSQRGVIRGKLKEFILAQYHLQVSNQELGEIIKIVAQKEEIESDLRLVGTWKHTKEQILAGKYKEVITQLHEEKTKTFYVGKHGIQSDKDCCVIALSDYFEISYSEAMAIAIKNGWTSAGISQKNFLIAVWELSGKKPRILKPENLTVAEAAKQIDSGFIFATDHVMQCSAFSVGNSKGYEDKLADLLVYV